MKRAIGVLQSAAVLVLAVAVLMIASAAWAQNGDQSSKAPISLPEDWSHRHLVFSNSQGTQVQGAQAQAKRELRYYQQWAARNKNWVRNHALASQATPAELTTDPAQNNDGRRLLGGAKQTPGSPRTNSSMAKRDWSYYLGGAAGASMAPGSFPAKFTFDVEAAPSCANDFVAYAVNKPGAAATTASATASFTSTPISGETLQVSNGASSITLTASTQNNTGLYFQTGAGVGTAGAASNLASAINRNGGTIGISGSSNGAAVTITAAAAGVAGNSITLTDGLSGIQLPARLSGGADGQASVVAFNNLYAGVAAPATATGNFSKRPGSDTTLVIHNGGTTLTVTATSTKTTSICTGTAPNFAVNFYRGSNSGGDSDVVAATNLSAAINACTNAGVSSTNIGSEVVITATAPGTAGNNITLTNTLSNLTIGSALSGGVDDGICGSTPTVMWAYNTTTASSPVLTSPVLSADGSKLAFVEQGSSAAVLHVLKWKAGEGANVTGRFSLNPASVQVVSNWAACPMEQSCIINVPFYLAVKDSNSAPFYDYSADVLYVGDDNGVLHKFVGIFRGVPAEVTTGWPITVHSGYQLTGPVFEPTSRNIFVGDSSGQLSYVRETGSTVGTCASGSAPCLGGTTQALGGAIVDPPLVDGTTQKVFAFEGTDTTSHGRVYQFDTTLGNQRQVNIGSGTTGNGYSQSYIHAGAFDNTYFASADGTGYLYVCGKDLSGYYDGPALHRISITAGQMSTTTTASGALTSASYEECSPVTEMYNDATGTDWLFFSVGNNASQTACGTTGGGCIMSTNATGSAWATVVAGYATPAGPTNPTTGTVSSSTSGIVVDNVSPAGQASSIYFTTSSATTCNTQGGGNVSGCAVKLTQSGLQ